MLSLATNDFNFSVLTLNLTVILAIDPGPANPTVLTLQQSHRSSLAWTASDDVDSVILTCRHREATIARMGAPNACIVPYLQSRIFWTHPCAVHIVRLASCYCTSREVAIGDTHISLNIWGGNHQIARCQYLIWTTG